jgi:hypothetical protein
LHKQRGELLKKEAELGHRREKLGELDREAEEAEHALLNAGAASSAELENWMAAGANGEMPGTSSTQLARLQENLMRAQYAQRAAGNYSHEDEAGMARGAKGQLENQGKELAEELFNNRTAIEDAALNVLMSKFRRWGYQIEKLQAERDGLAHALIAWRDFLSPLGDKPRRASFGVAGRQATEALERNKLPMHNSMDPNDAAEVEAEFERLCEGKIDAIT